MLKKLICISLTAIACSTQATPYTQCQNEEIRLDFRTLHEAQTQVIAHYQQQIVQLQGAMFSSSVTSEFKTTNESASSSMQLNVKKNNQVEVKLKTKSGTVFGVLTCLKAQPSLGK